MEEQIQDILAAQGAPLTQALLDADAMRFLYELGTQNRAYTVQQINGATYVNTDPDKPLSRIDPYEKPEPGELGGIYTLSGLVDYIKNDVDGHLTRHDRLQVIVTGYDKVEVWSPVHGEQRQRADRRVHLRAPADQPEPVHGSGAVQRDGADAL